MKKLQILDNGFFATAVNKEGEVTESANFANIAKNGFKGDSSVTTLYTFSEQSARLKPIPIQYVDKSIVYGFYTTLVKVTKSKMDKMQEKLDTDSTLVELEIQLDLVKLFYAGLCEFAKTLDKVDINPLEGALISIKLNQALPSIYGSDEYKKVLEGIKSVQKCGTLNGKEFSEYHKAVNDFVDLMGLGVKLNKSITKNIVKSMGGKFRIDKDGFVTFDGLKPIQKATQITLSILQGVQLKKRNMLEIDKEENDKAKKEA